MLFMQTLLPAIFTNVNALLLGLAETHAVCLVIVDNCANDENTQLEAQKEQ